MHVALLETLIALAFLYALLSIVASAIQEACASLINRRGKFLYDALDDVLTSLMPHGQGDAAGKVSAATVLQQPELRPLITRTTLDPGSSQAAGAPAPEETTIWKRNLPLNYHLELSRTTNPQSHDKYVRKNSPSYLPADLVASATTAALQAENLTVDSRLRRLVPASATEPTPEKAIANLYDATMERVSGRYARRTRIWLIAIGVVLAGVLNADTLRIAETLYREPAQRKQAADLAQTYYARHALSLSAGTDATQRALVDSTLSVLAQQIGTDTAALPLGWAVRNRVWRSCVGADLSCRTGGFSLMLFGWLLTAMAISYGAPFWFDLLGKLVNLRGAGQKPGTASSTSAKASIEIKTGDGPPTEIAASDPPR